MADVYLAEQESLSRHVAVKVLRPEATARPAAVQRFVLEARAAAARGADADQKAMEWRRRLEEEEQRLRTLVEEATPLLENQDEALRLLDWENMSLETLPTEFSA